MRKPTFGLVIVLHLLSIGCSKEAPVVEVSQGEKIFVANCKVCHVQGINGAPILGNASMWNKRKDQTLNTLVSHAVEGFGLMPAKGGNPQLTEPEIQEAVQFMLSKLEK